MRIVVGVWLSVWISITSWPAAAAPLGTTVAGVSRGVVHVDMSYGASSARLDAVETLEGNLGSVVKFSGSTLALVLLSAVAGVAIMRSQGARAGMQIQRSLAEMRDPSRPLAHGAMIIAAGLLLLQRKLEIDSVVLVAITLAYATGRITHTVADTKSGVHFITFLVALGAARSGDAQDAFRCGQRCRCGL